MKNKTEIWVPRFLMNSILSLIEYLIFLLSLTLGNFCQNFISSLIPLALIKSPNISSLLCEGAVSKE